jgi:RNA polymerase-binding transcription factor DksA
MTDNATLDELTPTVVAGLRSELETARDRAGSRSDQRDDDHAELIAEHDDPGDTLSDGAELAVAVSLVGTTDIAVELIDAALDRIDAGTYGACIECGGPVGIERLRALPSAERCLSCQADLERRARRAG